MRIALFAMSDLERAITVHFAPFQCLLFCENRLIISSCSPPAALYIEALLADEEAADAVWEAWDAGLISDKLAEMAWCILAACSDGSPHA